MPLHVEYALTPLGRDACVPIGAMLFWIHENIERFPNVTAGGQAGAGSRGGRDHGGPEHVRRL